MTASTNPVPTVPDPAAAEAVTARLLVLQRVCRHPGEFAPEVVSVVDEWTLDENPDWWPTEVRAQKSAVGSDADAWAEVEITLPLSALHAALYPAPAVPVTSIRSVPSADG